MLFSGMDINVEWKSSRGLVRPERGHEAGRNASGGKITRSKDEGGVCSSLAELSWDLWTTSSIANYRLDGKFARKKRQGCFDLVLTLPPLP